MNLPNLLTFSRVFLAVPIFILTLMGSSWFIPAVIIFIIASLTDMFDGMAARKMNLVSDFGKVMDQICDKILINSVFIALLAAGRLPAWFVAIMVARDTFVSGIRMHLASKNVVIAADKLGKLKTVLEIALIIMVYISFNQLATDIVLYATALVSIISGTNYFLKSKDKM